MKNIESTVKNYFDAWNDGFITKNGDVIRSFMSKQFIGYWAHSNLTKPDQYDYSYNLENVLNQMDNAKKSFQISNIAERANGSEYLINGRETNVINGVPYTAQCMFVWGLENEQWKLKREYIELER